MRRFRGRNALAVLAPSAWLMLSMPPAATSEKSPQRRSFAADTTARMADPHTLLKVMAPVDSGQPAPSVACRAGACPIPAASTQPM